MKYPPKFPKEPCGGVGRSEPDRIKAMEAIGASVQLAVEHRKHIEGLTDAQRPPIAPHRPGFDSIAWRVLATYLIEERRLIEFLLGPVVYPGKDGSPRYRNPNDICLDCFTSPQHRWRLPAGNVRQELHDRTSRINVRLAHFSWTLAQPDSRTDHGAWNTHYLDLVLGGLMQFAGYLETIGTLPAADTLRQAVIRAAPSP